MILYATKQTIKELNIPMPEELSTFNQLLSTKVIEQQKNNKLLEWGIKIFYFDGRKCIQAMNFASKLTVFIFDLEKEQIAYIADAIAKYLFDIYDNDKKMKKILEKFFDDYPVCAFSKLQDKSIITSLNHNQLDFAEDGYRFYDYIEKGILQTRKINNDVNWKHIVGINKNNKKDYIYPAEYFRELLLEKYDIE